MFKKIITWGSALIVLATITTGMIAYDSNIVKEKELSRVEAKFDLYLINQEMADNRKQLYEIRSRWSPKYEEDRGEPYTAIEHLLDFIKAHDTYDYDRYIETEERQEELKAQKKRIKDRDDK